MFRIFHRKNILPISLLLLGAGGLVFSFFHRFTLPDSGMDFSGKKKVILYPHKPVTQTFSVDREGFLGVDIALRNINFSTPGRINITLRDAGCRRILSEKTIARKQIANRRFYRLIFLDSPELPPERYCLTLIYRTDEDLPKKDLPQVSASKRAFVPGEEFVNTGAKKQKRNWRLVLRPLYTNGNFGDDIRELINRISQYKPSFVKSFPIALLAIIVFAGSILLAISLILTKETTTSSKTDKSPKL